jgi:eukaryotic-like serine/threonine-protein kinase
VTVSHAAPQRLQGGQAVLNYRVLRELGSRAAPVYAAHRVNGPHMELAVLQHFRRPRDAVSQLTGILRDARAVSEVAHPNLVRVHGAEPVGDEIVVATEFVEGEALGELRALASSQEAVISLQVYLRVLLEAMGGLATLHGTPDARRRPIGLYHGLVSPAEILVGLDGTARLVGVFHTVPLVVPPEAQPYVAYFAPEVLQGDRGIDKRADIYSAGALLWEALTGERPFHGMDAPQILAAHARGPIARPATPTDAAWAEPLVDVAVRALSADPRARFESIEEMLAAITPHTKVAPPTAVAMLVRQLAGEKILKRRGEFAEPSSHPADDDDHSVTAVAPPTRASGVERREDTVTTTVSEVSETSQADEPDDSVTKAPPMPAPLPEYADHSVTAAAPFPRSPSAPDLPDDHSITAIAPSVGAQPVAPARPSPASSSAARAITPAAGSPPRPSTHLPSQPLAPPKPAGSLPKLPVAIEDAEEVVTEVRAPLASEADFPDDSVTRQAPAPMMLSAELPRGPAPRDDDDEEEDRVETVTRDRVIPVAPVALPSLEAGGAADGEAEDDQSVTAVAVNAPVLPPKSDESVTRDRHPVSLALVAGRRVPSVASFPPPHALPGPSSLPAPLPRGNAVVAVDAMSREEAFGETMDLPSEGAIPYAQLAELSAPPPAPIAPHPIPVPAPSSPSAVMMSAPTDEELPPPSYKKLGIALGVAVIGAFALLVFVIVRASNQQVAGIAAAEVRTKAPHGVVYEDGPEIVAQRKTVTPPTRRWWPPPKKR